MGTAAHTAAVLVVEDDAVARGWICALLEGEGYATRAVESGEEALEALSGAPPQLVVLDVCLPGISGYEVCRSLRQHYGKQLAIVFVSGTRCESYDRVAGLLVGGDDYIVKPFAPDEFLARVRRLVRRPVLRHEAGRRLTARELEVLQLLSEGLGHRQVASQLSISPKTVSTHIEHILVKLRVSSRAQAVAAAYREGIVQTPV
jgi:DNA-binding NarL/FixJ family response regulator